MAFLRSLSVADLESVDRIIASSERKSAWPVGARWNLKGLQEELEQGGGLGACVDGGELAACIFYRKLPEGHEILQLATSPEHQGRGLMKQLLRRLRTVICPKDDIWLEVHAENRPARRLYEGLGFVLKGRRQNYYPQGGEACLYTWPCIADNI